jgi:glycosyltransferase involved in cell wall biosynthesis
VGRSHRGAAIPNAKPIHVLHVVEALGGGVTSAVRDYLGSSPHARHTVVARVRMRDDTGESLVGLAERVIEAPRSLLDAVRLVGHTFDDLRPDVVHAHSSYAGAWVRLARIPKRQIVYTPHCFAFERRDLGRVSRTLCWAAEATLARRTAIVAGVSPREVDLARGLRRDQQTAYVPNVVRVPEELVRPPRPVIAQLTVVTAGRVGPQKDPGFFAAVAEELAGHEPRPRMRWLGGGDERAASELREAGVEVTGWIPRGHVLEQLASADIYVHTAAWEGAPITVLEAASLGLPIVARRIPALESIGLEALADTPRAVATLVRDLRNPELHARAVQASRRLTARHRPADQARALAALYLRVASENHDAASSRSGWSQAL